jgi:hypothetical protein
VNNAAMLLLTISHLSSEDFVKALSMINVVTEDVQFIPYCVSWKKVAGVVISLAKYQCVCICD